MPEDDRNTLEVLKAELNFVQKGRLRPIASRALACTIGF